MTYNKTEIDTIKRNLKAIEEYATENWIPRLRREEGAHVKCGELKFYPNEFKREYEHSFGVNGDGTISWRTGGLILWLVAPAWCGKDRSLYDSWTYALDLFPLWEQIKRSMEQELAKKDAARNTVLNFTV